MTAAPSSGASPSSADLPDSPADADRSNGRSRRRPTRSLALGGLSLSRVARGFSALRVRNYRLWWFGQLISNTGSWMQTTAQAWLVLQLTNSPFAIGLVAVFQFLPVMVLALFGGVIADRLPRYKLIIATQTTLMLLAGLFGALVGLHLIQLWQVYVIAFAGGVVNAVDAPVRQTFAVDLVNREERSNAVALNSMLFNMARIVGPAVAGLLIGPFGIAVALYINAASYLAVLASLLMMRPEEFYNEARPTSGSMLSRLGEGLKYVGKTREILRVMLLIGAIGTFGYNFSVTLPLIAGFILHTDAVQYGTLGTALGIGSLLAAFALAYSRKVTQLRLIIAAAAFSVLLGALALITDYHIALVALLLMGFAGVNFTTASNTFLQLNVPDELRGRVMSVYSLLFMGSTPIGGLIIGTAAHAFSVPIALLICSGLCLTGVGITLVYGGHSE